VDGTRWNSKIAIGPWGACLSLSTNASTASYCGPYPDGGLARGAVVSPSMGAMIGRSVDVVPGQASPGVAYLKITTKDGRTTRVPVVAAGSERWFAYADVRGNRVVRWAAYSESGRRLAAGSGEVP
jgi:hypothetical protein